MSRIKAVDGPQIKIIRKFLVWNFKSKSIPADAVVSEITQEYLVSDGPDERYVRKTVGQDKTAYFFFKKFPILDNSMPIEMGRELTELEYLSLREYRDPDSLTIKKGQYKFSYDNRLLELDLFAEEWAGLAMLRVVLQHRGDKIVLPPNWEIKDVTDDPLYQDRYLAKPH
ncbi:MAG: hypothetical protein WAW90_01940 [Minisyncoccia bacterium]